MSATTHYQAWQLGGLAAKLDAGLVPDSDAIAEATCILQPHDCTSPGRIALLTRTELLDMGQLLASRYTTGGTLSRVSGVLTFANLIWAFGAVGIAVAFFPAVMPIAKLLKPALMVVHFALLPFYGMLCYSACLYILAWATRWVPYMHVVCMRSHVCMGQHGTCGGLHTLAWCQATCMRA